MPRMRRYAAEALGTFAVIFTGCGAAAVGGVKLGTLGVALAFGFALGAVTIAMAPISGAHLNPAVTLAMALVGRLPRRDILPYMAAQIAGAVAGTALVVTMAEGRPGGATHVADTIANGYGSRSPGFYALGAAAIAEVVLTGIFVLVVLAGATRIGAARGPRLEVSPASLAITAGAAYTLIHLVGMPVTRLGANPARALGPALLAGGQALTQSWLFVVAPLLGAALAALAHRALHSAPKEAAAASRETPESAPRAL